MSEILRYTYHLNNEECVQVYLYKCGHTVWEIYVNNPKFPGDHNIPLQTFTDFKAAKDRFDKLVDWFTF